MFLLSAGMHGALLSYVAPWSVFPSLTAVPVLLLPAGEGGGAAPPGMASREAVEEVAEAQEEAVSEEGVFWEVEQAAVVGKGSVADHPAPLPPPTARPLRRPVVKAPPRPGAVSRPLAQSLSKPQTQAGAGEGQDAPSGVQERVRGQILAVLRRYFTYPPMARKRGWQGEVHLSFRVTALGALEGIEVRRGSGFAVLDRAAVVALQRVGALPAPGVAVAMELPVVYRLQSL